MVYFQILPGVTSDTVTAKQLYHSSPSGFASIGHVCSHINHPVSLPGRSRTDDLLFPKQADYQAFPRVGGGTPYEIQTRDTGLRGQRVIATPTEHGDRTGNPNGI